MRWFVEISSVGLKPGPSTTLCVEADQWQPALQKARALRGDEGALSNFSIDLLEDGFRAIDPESRTRYVVKRAPDDAALSNGQAATTPQDAQKGRPGGVADASPQTSSPTPASPPEPTPKRPLAQTMVFGSPGTASVVESNRPPPAPKAEAPARIAPTIPQKTAPPVTMGPQAALHPGGLASQALDPGPLQGPAPAIGSIPRPPAPLPSFQILTQREDNPTEQSPLSYREVVFAVVPTTTEEDARRLIFERFEHVRNSLEQARPGKLINLAIFDHAFQGRPLRRPIVTLSWKDWKHSEPELKYPHRDAPPKSSSPPGSSQGETRSAAKWPASAAPQPPSTPAAGAPAPAQSAAFAQGTPTSAVPSSPSAPPGPTLPSAPSVPTPTSAARVVVVDASSIPVAAAPSAPVPVPAPSASPPLPIRMASPAPAAPVPVAVPDSGRAVPPTAPVPTKLAAGAMLPFQPVAAQAPSALPSTPAAGQEPTAMPAPPPPPAVVQPRKRLSGEDLLAELFEAFGDLAFLRDSLEGAEFVLGLTLEKLPSEVGLVSLFDINNRDFVVVRQVGGPRSALCQRLSERAPTAASAMRKRHAVVISDPEGVARATDDRWGAIGTELKSLVCAPVELGGRYLGLIELANPLDGDVFNEGDGNALTYIGQQFAEFVAARGIAIDPDLIRERAAGAAPGKRSP